MTSIDTYKIVMLGAGKSDRQVGVARVGKTSLTLRYVKNEFTEHQTKTMNASFLPKSVPVAEKQYVTVNVWVRKLPYCIGYRGTGDLPCLEPALLQRC